MAEHNKGVPWDKSRKRDGLPPGIHRKKRLNGKKTYYYYTVSAIDENDKCHRVDIRYFPHIKGNSKLMLEAAIEQRNKWVSEFYNTPPEKDIVKPTGRGKRVSIPESLYLTMYQLLQGSKSRSKMVAQLLKDLDTTVK